MPALTISAATSSEAIASALVKPVVRITTPATAVPMKAYRSVSTCRKLPSTFRLRRLARPSTMAAARLTSTPTSASTSIGPPATGGGLASRVIASITKNTDRPSRVAPLASAERISARLSP